jgi:hypothetical protein
LCLLRAITMREQAVDGGALALDDDMYNKTDAILVVRGIGGLRDRYRAVGVGWSAFTICWSSPALSCGDVHG